ncbi:MAG: hypothetical protein A2039_04570 [Candidatus Melainabacteria bacterium GWA2_34_9]|nr:MAG: hypothetical protein A2039_04570 [Candidatus Melainabacteria bacterium GWA2_34_9]
MSVPKDRLHELIEEIPDNETESVVIIIEDFLKNIKKSKLSQLYENPLKVEGAVEIPSREARNAR